MNDPKFHTDRGFHTKVCLRCHSDKEMMKRNSVFNVAITTYMEVITGKTIGSVIRKRSPVAPIVIRLMQC